MTSLTNRIRAGGFVQSEANFYRSRDHVTIEGGTGGAGKVNAGTVLGQITSTKKFIPWAHAASDGSQTAVAILWDDVDVAARRGRHHRSFVSFSRNLFVAARDKAAALLLKG
jgi:hypothetical protein